MPSKVTNKPEVVVKKVKATKEKLAVFKKMYDSKSDFMQELNLQQMSGSIAALLEVIRQQKSQQKKKSLFKDEPKEILLQILPVKIPVMKSMQIRIVLPHSLVIDHSDVCLITQNVKKSTKDDHDPTINHYKNFLEDQKIKGVTQIVPIRQLRADYGSFEMKGRFADMYDRFLVDNRLYGKLTKFLGSRFFKKNKDLIPVKLNTMKIKKRIERGLTLTVLTVHGKGDCFSVQVGFSHFSNEQLQENICAVVEALTDHFPGGFNNVRKLLIKSQLSLAIPLYISLKRSNSVKVPIVEEKLPKAYQAVEGELTTMPGGFVTVLPTGETFVKRRYVQEDVDLGFARSTKQSVGKEYISCKNDEEDEYEDVEVGDKEEEKEAHNANDDPQTKKRKIAKIKTNDDGESSDDDVEAAEDAYLEDLECEIKQQSGKRARNKRALKQQQEKSNKKANNSEEAESESTVVLSKKHQKKRKSNPEEEPVSESKTRKQKKMKLSKDRGVKETEVKGKKQPKRPKDKASRELATELAEPKTKKMKPRKDETVSRKLSQNNPVTSSLQDKPKKNLAKELKKKIKNKNDKNKSLSETSTTFSMRLAPQKSLNNVETVKKRKKEAKILGLSHNDEISINSYNSKITSKKSHKTVKPTFDRYFSTKHEKTLG